MVRFKYISLMMVAFFIFPALPAVAQSDLSKQSQDRLERLMDQEEEINEDDVKIYLQNADKIFKLRFEPNTLNDTIRSIDHWTEKRFTYVTTKMAAGMALLMNPTDSRNSSMPSFARPSSTELSLIKRYQSELDRAMSSAQASYSINKPGN